MPLGNPISGVLNEPTKNEREILRQDFPDKDEGHEIKPLTNQQSLLSMLDADLEAHVVQVNKNTNQKLIIVTQDKALLCLKRNLALLGKKDWIAPLSTVITILIALITSDFKTALWLGPSEWKAIFIVSGFIAVGWLSYTLRKALNAKPFHSIIIDIVYELGARQKPKVEPLN